MSGASAHPAALRRRIGPLSAVMITVGSVIGSGIFMKPLDISRALPDPLWIHACWIVLGLVCLCGALSYGELGTRMPGAGGQYEFLQRCWGPFPAFLYGWSLLLITNTGTLAALALAFSQNLLLLFPLPEALRIPLALSMILGLATVNHFGVGWGAVLQNVSTLAKLGALLLIVGASFLLGGGSDAAPVTTVTPPESPDVLAGLVMACVAIFWAYEGWHQLPFSAEELRNPRRDLPRGLIFGVLILVGTYALVNATYLAVVPQEEMRTLAQEMDVPRLAVTRLFGPAAATWLTLLVCLSVFGAGNPNLLSAPRAFFAMARDGLMPAWMARVHARHRTPTAAIWVQAGWACLLVVVLEEFHDVTEYVIFASLLFYALTVAGLFVARRRPAEQDVFRCPLFPLTPLVFILVVLGVDTYTLTQPDQRENALVGLGILVAGALVYAGFLRGRTPAGG